METDTLSSRVINWLEHIPAKFDNSEPTPRIQTRSDLKRRRLSISDQSASKRQLISPPSSQDEHHIAGMDLTANTTPNKKRPASTSGQSNEEIDNDETPRGDPNKGKQRGFGKAESLHSESSSEYSRSSKRSRGSASPLKLSYVSGPYGHRLARDGSAALHSNKLSAVRELIEDFEDIQSRLCIMPKRIEEALKKQGVGRLNNGMFFDDHHLTHGPCADDLVRQALRIVRHSNICSTQLQDEAAWNNLVHSRLLDLFIHDMHDGPGQDILDYMPCNTTNMNISYHRFDVPASRVDYVVRLPAQPERNTQDDEPIDLLDSNRMPILNWTANQLVPIAFSIETKRYGGDVLKGEQQLGIWNAAQWEYLISKAGVDAANKLDFIPGLVVHGETWSLVITTRQHSKTTLFPGIPFGHTQSPIGVFQVIAGLRRLRRWVLDVMWPWYKQYLPGLQLPGSIKQQKNIIMAGGSQTVQSEEQQGAGELTRMAT